MKHLLIASLLLSAATGALAQNTNTNTSGSSSGAISGSASGSQSTSDQTQGQAQTANNAGIGNSESNSESNAGAISGSASSSESNGNLQGQSQGQNQAQEQGQANSQGVSFEQTFITRNRRETEVRTNQAVPLAASSSFSSDYCGGTVSGGASAAPIGISIGAAAPKYDKSCQSLRRAEKFGMAAVNAQNLGQQVLAGKLMSMMIWSICTSDSGGPDAGKSTAEACEKLLLLGPAASQASAPPPRSIQPMQAATAKVRNPDGTPTAAVVGRVAADQLAENKINAAAVKP